MQTTLLILAAGMGSRYGGLKQLDPIGPSGETLLDYAVFDAIRGGFDRVLFVIRRDFEDAFRARVGARYADRVQVDYVFQEIAALPPGLVPPAGREKPWGTGHAVWCARDAVAGPFAVINADDFYGRDAYSALAGFLRTRDVTAPDFAIAGYRLGNTLSEHGAVSRGVCEVDAGGFLTRITEHTGILPGQVGAGLAYSPDTVVSMNCWGFTPALFPALDRRFAAFLRELPAAADPLKAEFYLPAAVSSMIAADAATVRVLPNSSAWFGVTYREDKPRVETAIRALVEHGDYPADLWSRA